MIAHQQAAGRNYADNTQLKVENAQGASADILQPPRSRRAVGRSGLGGDQREKFDRRQDKFTGQPE